MLPLPLHENYQVLELYWIDMGVVRVRCLRFKFKLLYLIEDEDCEGVGFKGSKEY